MKRKRIFEPEDIKVSEKAKALKIVPEAVFFYVCLKETERRLLNLKENLFFPSVTKQEVREFELRYQKCYSRIITLATETRYRALVDSDICLESLKYVFDDKRLGEFKALRVLLNKMYRCSMYVCDMNDLLARLVWVLYEYRSYNLLAFERDFRAERSDFKARRDFLGKMTLCLNKN